MDRVTAIRKSLTVFVCGIIGFLPVIGFLPAIYALVHWEKVRAGYRNQWNPASTYLKGGAVLAIIGVLSSVLILASVMLALMQ